MPCLNTKTMPCNMRGFVREVFTSIQGEGIRVGQRQTFVRLYGCNLRCQYCDTPETQKNTGPFFYQGKTLKNPVGVHSVIDKISERVVAVTGGEPLVQPDFLNELCVNIKDSGKEIYLDTNGTLPDKLQQVIQYIDTIALDFKIPSATRVPQLWEQHEQCLIIASTKNVFVKIIIDENISQDELEKTCAIITSVDTSIPLVLQPVFGHTIPGILDIQQKLLTRLDDVRIIPQIHKYLGLP